MEWTRTTAVLSYMAILLCALLGFAHGPLWVAVVAGLVFGVPSVVEMHRMVRARAFPIDRHILWFYAQGLLNGVCAACAGYFLGKGAYHHWFP